MRKTWLNKMCKNKYEGNMAKRTRVNLTWLSKKCKFKREGNMAHTNRVKVRCDTIEHG